MFSISWVTLLDLRFVDKKKVFTHTFNVVVSYQVQLVTCRYRVQTRITRNGVRDYGVVPNFGDWEWDNS